MAKARFEWDPSKDQENQEKHGVAFAMAQFAFADPRRVIAEDLSHSSTEIRYYCFGQVGDGVLTVRFTYRDDVIRIYGAGYWLEVVPDFLPRPEDLVFRDEGVKVTISLSKRSVEFFKNEARKHNTQYQRMIRRLLDAYAEHHAKRPLTARSTRTRDKSSRAGGRER